MFKGLLNNFLNLIYKQKCVICSCSKTDCLLCKNCLKEVVFLSGFPHKIYISTPIYSACVYTGVVKKIIQLFKFSHKKNLSKLLAQLGFEYFKKLNLNKNFIVIYPDSFIFKSLFRGYEHMYLIARDFCALGGFKLYKHAILKIKNTKAQYQAKNRKENIKGAFKINKKYINTLKNNPVLLIDDITTSGSTLEEIINILKNENINDITCFTISKAQKN